MVKIRKMCQGGDEVQTVKLDKAMDIITDNLEKGNVVFDETEKKIITKATMNQVKEDSNVGVFPAIRGG
jgi:hypothetical protein